MTNIIDTIGQMGSFEILSKAIRQSNLIDVLSSRGPFTLFAPTDDAFHKLPQGVLEELFSEDGRLRDILTYHISAGKSTSDELMLLSELDTLEGEPLTIITEDDYLMVDNSKIIKKDLECENGIIHVIDLVLMP